MSGNGNGKGEAMTGTALRLMFGIAEHRWGPFAAWKNDECPSEAERQAFTNWSDSFAAVASSTSEGSVRMRIRFAASFAKGEKNAVWFKEKKGQAFMAVAAAIEMGFIPPSFGALRKKDK